MKIITPIRPHSTEELTHFIDQIDGRADFVEVWLDNLHEVEPDQNWIATCKSPVERGDFSGTEEERIEILQKFLENGGTYADLDVTQNSAKNIQQILPEKLILSFHDFIGDADLEDIVKKMQEFKPAIYKFAVAVNSPEALDRFLDFARSLEGEAIFTTMGEFGVEGREIIRIEDLSWGEFVALDEDSRTAEGQMTLDEI